MLSIELYAQDRYSYLPGESERLLSQNIALYEVCIMFNIYIFILL